MSYSCSRYLTGIKVIPLDLLSYKDPALSHNSVYFGAFQCTEYNIIQDQTCWSTCNIIDLVQSAFLDGCTKPRSHRVALLTKLHEIGPAASIFRLDAALELCYTLIGVIVIPCSYIYENSIFQHLAKIQLVVPDRSNVDCEIQVSPVLHDFWVYLTNHFVPSYTLYTLYLVCCGVPSLPEAIVTSTQP